MAQTKLVMHPQSNLEAVIKLLTSPNSQITWFVFQDIEVVDHERLFPALRQSNVDWITLQNNSKKIASYVVNLIITQGLKQKITGMDFDKLKSEALEEALALFSNPSCKIDWIDFQNITELNEAHSKLLKDSHLTKIGLKNTPVATRILDSLPQSVKTVRVYDNNSLDVVLKYLRENKINISKLEIVIGFNIQPQLVQGLFNFLSGKNIELFINHRKIVPAPVAAAPKFTPPPAAGLKAPPQVAAVPMSTAPSVAAVSMFAQKPAPAVPTPAAARTPTQQVQSKRTNVQFLAGDESSEQSAPPPARKRAAKPAAAATPPQAKQILSAAIPAAAKAPGPRTDNDVRVTATTVDDLTQLALAAVPTSTQDQIQVKQEKPHSPGRR